MKRSLKFRLLTWGIGSILGVATGLSVYSSFTLKDELVEKSQAQSEMVLADLTSEIEQKILRAKESTMAMSAMLAQLNDEHQMRIDRKHMNDILERQLEGNSTFFGTYTLFEPNAFDGKDNDFANKPFHDKTGRMIPYITRKDGGGFNIDPLVDYEKEGAGDYYLIPKKTKQVFLSAPYDYPVGDKKVLMISIVAPVLSSGEFKGIAGIDVSLDFFQQMADSIKLPPGGRVIIFDDAGTIVGFTGNAKAIYKNVFSEKFDQYENLKKDRITNKEDFHLGEFNLSALRPIHLDGKTWFAEIVIPKSTIMAPIQAALLKQIGISVGLAACFIFFGLWMLNKIAYNVTIIAQKLEKTTEENRTATENVKDTSTQVASATNEQAAAIEETASALDEISAMVARSVENAQQSANQSEKSLKTAHLGKETVERMIDSIQEISKSNEEIMGQINDSNNEIRSIINMINEISEKTKVINDIVFQTKLLSFNASVEAARAGENGKGFAVVAEEVGKLAEMSGNSAKEINELLDNSGRRVEEIIRKTQDRVQSLAQSGRGKIQDGVNVANECGRLLDEIVDGADRVKAMMSDLAEANKQQSEGIRNITDAMGMLQTTTQANNNSVNMMADNTQRLFQETVALAENTMELKKEVFGLKAA